MRTEINHPLLDGANEGWAATELRSDVVALTPEIADFISRTVQDSNMPIIVSPPYSRMTEALWQMMSQVSGLWLIRTGPDEFYEARSGAQSTSIFEALNATVQNSEISQEFLRPLPPTTQHIAYNVMTRHRVSRQVRLGGVVEAIAQSRELEDSLRWGAWEPSTADWDRDEVTEFSRKRMPKRSYWSVTGGKPGDVGGTLGIIRTDEGVEETTHLSVNVTTNSPLPLNEAATQTLRAAANYGMPLIGVALGHQSAFAGCRSPHFSLPPEPLALLLGPAAVRMLKVRPEVWLNNFDAKSLGSPRIPSILFDLKGGDEGWRILREILATPEPEILAEALDTEPEVAQALSQLNTNNENGEA